MSRIKIEFPQAFTFSTEIPVRITDVNFGGHVGNDSILSILHEARMQFFKFYGYDENNFAGTATIMSDVVINYKSESFYGDVFRIFVAATNLSRVSFDVVYLLEKESNGKKVTVAEAKTGMVCFDYVKKKVTSLPEDVKIKWSV